MQKSADPKKILIVLHQEHSSPGKLGQMLKAKGLELDIRKPRFGEPLPETMEEHAGSIIFGGPMSANDTDDFVRREIDWIGVPLKEGAPFLGICLGAQMLVKHLGGKVSAHGEGCAEVGFYKLHATHEGRALGHWPSMVYQWHREGFDLPDGAVLLARGDIFENQAFSMNETAFGVQFHSELTYAMACRWTVRGAARFALPKAQSRSEHMAGWFRYDPPVRAWLWNFLDTWLAQDKRRNAARRPPDTRETERFRALSRVRLRQDSSRVASPSSAAELWALPVITDISASSVRQKDYIPTSPGEDAAYVEPRVRLGGD